MPRSIKSGISAFPSIPRTSPLAPRARLEFSGAHPVNGFEASRTTIRWRPKRRRTARLPQRSRAPQAAEQRMIAAVQPAVEALPAGLPAELVEPLGSAVGAFQGAMTVVATFLERERIDVKTGLLTYRAGLDAIWAVAHLSDPRPPVAFAMFDIDWFKSVNDDFGHPVGDRVLAAVANQIRKRSRRNDIAVRYGGEELLWALPRTNLGGAKQLVERVRKAVQAMTMFVDDSVVRVTVSAGIAELRRDESVNDAIARADAALYWAKRRRNQVSIWTTQMRLGKTMGSPDRSAARRFFAVS
jgi:diguanylate cyclase (GGDEF)-like protein